MFKGISQSEILRAVVATKKGKIGLTLVFFFIFMAIFADLLSPYNPFDRVGPPFAAPSTKHPLGLNDIGQDLLSELIHGARVSLLVGFAAASVRTLIGLLVGLMAGYFGGALDDWTMRFVDVLLILPSLPLMILLAAYVGQSIWNIILIISLLGWPGLARLVRSQTLTLRERPYVEAARSMGITNLSIVFTVIFPNMFPLVLANTVLDIMGAILSEAGLSFLGLGDPTHKSWGMMLYYAQQRNAFFQHLWYWIAFPGLCITLIGLGFALVGMTLDEVANPRLRRRV